MTTLQLIKAELLSTGSNFPLLVVCKISRLYVNRDLVNFFRRLMTDAKDDNERLLLLLKLKKLVLQVPREPDANELAAEPEKFYVFFNEIEREQAFYDPIKWLDAEIEYLFSVQKSVDVEVKEKIAFKDIEWHTEEEVLRYFKISKSTLNRRIAEGLPAYDFGARPLFNTKEISNYLIKQKVAVSNGK